MYKEVLLPFKGKSYDSGVVFCPYIPGLQPDPITASPHFKGFGTHKHEVARMVLSSMNNYNWEEGISRTNFLSENHISSPQFIMWLMDEYKIPEENIFQLYANMTDSFFRKLVKKYQIKHIGQNG